MATLNSGAIDLPKSVSTYIVNKAKDASTIAALSPSSPQLFNDSDYLIFSADAEAEVVAEGAKKSSHDYTTTTVVGKRFKVQTTTRVTAELKWADEDNRLQIIEQIQADQAGALGRALDYVVYHAVNPKDGKPLTGYTGLASSATAVTASEDVVYDIDALIDAINDKYDINGIAMAKSLAQTLRKVRAPQTMMPYYPSIPLDLKLSTFEGIAAATSGTVSGRVNKTAPNTLAFIGDFSLIKWGMVRDLKSEIIEWGDPDQTGVDLKANNQVAYRTEAMFAYAIIDSSAFAVLKGTGYDVSKAFSKYLPATTAPSSSSGGNS